jgi:hypothetical protein
MGKKTTQTQSSKSGNYAYEGLRSAFDPTIRQGGLAGGALTALLGLGGDAAEQEASFNRWLDSSGYQFALDQGNRAISGSAAGRGMLRSGATMKALSDYGQKTGASFFQNYLDRLAQMQGAGLSAGGLMSDAGRWSESQGKTTESGGIGGLLGSALSIGSRFIPSDPRLKKDVEKIGEREDGLGIYEYRYIWEDDEAEKTTGVMADEVARLRPDALGPTIFGYATVNYGRL